MNVSSTNGLTSSADLAEATRQTGTTALGQDAFLKLLTTQMQYQDPLNPMSNEEFVSQLAQFSSLEQLQGIGKDMESLYLVGVSQNNASMANLLGQDAVAMSDTIHYTGSDAKELYYDSAGAIADATVTITDSNGDVVFSGPVGSVEEGEGSWTWNGKTTSGAVAAEGDYTVSFTGEDASGSDVAVTGQVRGLVSDMDFSDGTPQPMVDGVAVGIGDILKLSTPDDGSDDTSSDTEQTT